MIEIVIGDDTTIFKGFDFEEDEPVDKVKLTEMCFASEWRDYIDYDKSFAYIKDGKLCVNIYGIPKHIKEKAIKEFFIRQIEYYLIVGYGEFFEIEEGCPLCMIVLHNGKEVIV